MILIIVCSDISVVVLVPYAKVKHYLIHVGGYSLLLDTAFLSMVNGIARKCRKFGIVLNRMVSCFSPVLQLIQISLSNV